MNKQKQFKLISLANLLLLLLAYGLIAWFSVRYQMTTDLTHTGRHTLSEASRQVLAETSMPLSISAYAREDSELRLLIRNFIAKFQRHKTDITLQFVNPDSVPDEIRELGINVNGELILRYDGRSEHVRSENEQEFINALQRLLRGSERWLAFLVGHGERHPVGKANHDLGEWAQQLKHRGYKVHPLNLVETAAIPDNTAVLVIASPLVSLLQGELESIQQYLSDGGNLLWLTDPNDPSGMTSIADFLGIEFAAGVVIDTAGQHVGINDPTITLTTPSLYPQHPITKGFGLTVFFPKATSLIVKSGSLWNARDLLLSGNHTWLELGALSGEVMFNPDQEQQGPLKLGLSLKRKVEDKNADQKEQRIVIIGDGDFLSNTYVGNSGNLELGVRIINWLSNDDNLISIPVSSVRDAKLEVSQISLGILAVTFLFALPLIFITSGLFIWWRRKKL
ncbi:MAG: ABC transporter [Gammaproteobacteria bacterium]|nr:ABC transporter [Gammaproteobacteria bacterium]